MKTTRAVDSTTPCSPSKTVCRADLEKWCDRLDNLGIAHGSIKTAHYGSGISFRDPDNIALEFFCSPGT